MVNINHYTSALSKEELGVLLLLLDKQEKIVRVTADIQGVLYNFSPSFFQLFGKEQSENTQKIVKLIEFFDETDNETLLAMLFQAIMWQRIKSKEFYLYRLDAFNGKTLVKYEVIATPWSCLQGASNLNQCTTIDVEPKLSRPLVELIFIPKLVDEYFSYEDLQQHRVMNLGTLSLGVAHDLNNLLTGVDTVTTLLQPQLHDVHLQQYVNTIQRSVQQAIQLTGNILQFVKGSQDDYKGDSIYPIKVLQETLQVFQHSLEETVSCSTDWTTENIPLSMSIGDLTQIFINLLINARDAISRQGKITISTNYRYCDRAIEFIIKVSDTGSGIDAKTQINMFKPFFTTKSNQSNAGLGLTIVQSLIEKVGGKIECHSNKDKGACFTVTLPVKNLSSLL